MSEDKMFFAYNLFVLMTTLDTSGFRILHMHWMHMHIRKQYLNKYKPIHLAFYLHVQFERK